MKMWEIRLPLPQKPLNRSSPIMSGTPPPMQNFITIQLPLSTPKYVKMRIKWLGYFFGSSFHLQPRFLHQFSRSIRQMTSFHARMCVLVVPKILHFDPIFPRKQFFAYFLWDLKKFRVKKALTMGMLICKLPLIVIVAQWKLYSE